MLKWIKKEKEIDEKKLICSPCTKEEAESVYAIRKELKEYLPIVGYCKKDSYYIVQEKLGKEIKLDSCKKQEVVGKGIINNIISLHKRNLFSSFNIKGIYLYRNKIYFTNPERLRIASNAKILVEEFIAVLKTLKLYGIIDEVEQEYYLIEYIDENRELCRAWHLRQYYKEGDEIKIFEKLKDML